jgi:hypothetical protein
VGPGVSCGWFVPQREFRPRNRRMVADGRSAAEHEREWRPPDRVRSSLRRLSRLTWRYEPRADTNQRDGLCFAEARRLHSRGGQYHHSMPSDRTKLATESPILFCKSRE